MVFQVSRLAGRADADARLEGMRFSKAEVGWLAPF